MLYRSQEEFWWNNITGAHAVVEQVAMALLENKMVVLQVPSDLPWRYSMRSAIQSVFNERTNSRDIIIEMIDARDDNPAGLDPGHLSCSVLQPAALPLDTEKKEEFPFRIIFLSVK